MFDTVFDIFANILECITLYTAIIGAFFLIPRKKPVPTVPQTRFAVLIPARNEENVITALLDSLWNQSYPRELYDVYVIPNNCTDDTEGAARRAGAGVLPCLGEPRNKGDVLHQAFSQLMGKYDAYCVFDADNVVDRNFLARMNDAVVRGAQAAKCRQVASNPYDSWVAGCYGLYIENFNLMYNRPRAFLGLSARLVGTGFMVTDQLMHRLGGWNTTSITEDAEFAAQCALNGVRIHYVPEAITYDEQPNSFRVSLRQRRRWSAGVQSTANDYVCRLMKRPNFLRLDVSIYLSNIYVQLLACIPVCHQLLKMPVFGIVRTLAVSLGTFWIGMVATALFLTIAGHRNPVRMAKSILLYPVFTASWYPLHILGLIAKPKCWTPIPHVGKAGVRQSRD